MSRNLSGSGGKVFYTELTVITFFLSVSPSPPDADPDRDGEVTLACTLLRQNDLGDCESNSIRWVDETGTVLNGAEYEFHGPINCTSYLTVRRQSGNNRTHTCQFVGRGNIVKVESDYTLVFTDDNRNDQPGKSDSGKIICSTPDTVFHVGFSTR